MTHELAAILNLKTNESIGIELSNRQREVIWRAYQYLCTSNVIYIADEVGLGKTYIALGVALLLRHFSNDPEQHRNAIIVPKKYLQEKWKKEFRQFIQHNYLPDTPFIKEHLRNHISIHEKVVPIKQNDLIPIFRMSSFSVIGRSYEAPRELYDYLQDELFGPSNFLAQKILYEAWLKGYFEVSEEKELALRKLIAYLLNATSPGIHCLIIDESHNYKHGVGSNNVAFRNTLTACYLGAVQDRKIFSDFPELAEVVKFPLAGKVICLSATPKDKHLLEIRNQLDCFTNSHILSGAQKPEDVSSQLRKFLVRGNLEYNIRSGPVSRNQCREEHRKGNVEKQEQPEPMTMEDNFSAVFWQLIQYQSIKYFHQKNNPSFEIGMLAGFESYMLDADKKLAAKKKPEEYEQTVSRAIKESQDINVVRSIVNDYRKNFTTELPPHPKQSKLEKEIIRQLHTEEKSLIFVRRIATAYELQERLLACYEQEIIFKGKLEKLPPRFQSAPVQQMMTEYSERNILKKRPEVFALLLERPEIKSRFSPEMPVADRLLWLKEAYQQDPQFAAQVKNHIIRERVNLSAEMKQLAIQALATSRTAFDIRMSPLSEPDNEKPEISTGKGYFFTNYFKEKEDGHFYRNRMDNKDWFELDLIALNRSIPIFLYEEKLLFQVIDAQPKGTGKKRKLPLKQKEKIIRQFLTNNGSLLEHAATTIGRTASNSTFLTYLLTGPCQHHMQRFLVRRKHNAIGHILDDIHLLAVMLKQVFRNGSGLLPGFIAGTSKLNFNDAMFSLLAAKESLFHFVLKEVNTIIDDFDLIMSTNFSERGELDINATMKALNPITVTTGNDDINRATMAARFRMPGFPYVLVTTDIFREGVDLHTYCQHVYHYGVAWNPSDMEQRTGRIDRINSLSYRKINRDRDLTFDNKIQVFYPYLRQSVEVNQVIRLLNNLDRFITDFNDIEKNNDYDTKVLIDKTIQETEIPEQIKGRLKSLYDIWEFKVPV